MFIAAYFWLELYIKYENRERIALASKEQPQALFAFLVSLIDFSKNWTLHFFAQCPCSLLATTVIERLFRMLSSASRSLWRSFQTQLPIPSLSIRSEMSDFCGFNYIPHRNLATGGEERERFNSLIFISKSCYNVPRFGVETHGFVDSSPRISVMARFLRSLPSTIIGPPWKPRMADPSSKGIWCLDSVMVLIWSSMK